MGITLDQRVGTSVAGYGESRGLER